MARRHTRLIAPVAILPSVAEEEAAAGWAARVELAEMLGSPPADVADE